MGVTGLISRVFMARSCIFVLVQASVHFTHFTFMFFVIGTVILPMRSRKNIQIFISLNMVILLLRFSLLLKRF